MDPSDGSPRQHIVTDDGRSFVAPAGECLLVSVPAEDRLVAPDVGPCRVDGLGVRCVVLQAGEKATLYGRSAESADGLVDWAPAEGCDLSCVSAH